MAYAAPIARGTAGEARAIDAAGPDQQLIERVRANLLKDDDLQRVYAYRLKRRSYEVSRLGKVENGDERLYEHVPSPDEPSGYFRRLLAVNGKPVPPDRIRESDERRREHAAERHQAAAKETPSQRAERLRRAQERRREEEEQLADAFRVFRFETAGHEMLDGRSCLVVVLTPRPDVRTKSDIGKHLKKLRGKAWVDEDAAQLVRLEMEAADTVFVGFGVIGRLDEGSRAWYRRAPVDGGAWMPIEARFKGTGRTLVFRWFELETYALYSDYRRLAAGE